MVNAVIGVNEWLLIGSAALKILADSQKLDFRIPADFDILLHTTPSQNAFMNYGYSSNQIEDNKTFIREDSQFDCIVIKDKQFSGYQYTLDGKQFRVASIEILKQFKMLELEANSEIIDTTKTEADLLLLNELKKGINLKVINFNEKQKSDEELKNIGSIRKKLLF